MHLNIKDSLNQQYMKSTANCKKTIAGVVPGFEGRSYGRRLLFSRGPECRNKMEGSLFKRTLHSYVTYRSIEMLTKLLRYLFFFLAFFFVAFFLAFFFFAIILSPPFG
jgi:hypothetical protein